MILLLLSLLLLPGNGSIQSYSQQSLEKMCNQKSHVNPNNYYFDSCEQRCECVESQRTFQFKCFRERENYECMNPERRRRFHQAIRDVSVPSDPLYGTMKAFIDRHGVGFPIVHTDEHFLHFHRAYQYELETILRQKDCRITIPYWSFSDRPVNPFPYLPFTAQGMGDNGNCVATGPFASWIPADKSTCLARNFASPPVLPTLTQLNQIMALVGTDFTTFANQMQYTFHNGVHVTIGGDSVTVISPNEPLFFLLHDNIDRVWDLWQKLSPDRMNTYPYPDNLIPYTGTAIGTVRPSDVNSLESTGVRYVQVLTSDIQNGIHPTCGYVKCQDSCFLRSRIEQLYMNTSLDNLLDIRQNQPRTLSSNQQKAWIKMMGITKKSRQFIRKSLQQSEGQVEALSNSLSDITEEPLDFGIDVQAFVNSIGLEPDSYPVDGICGTVPAPSTIPPTMRYVPPSMPYVPPSMPYVPPTTRYVPPTRQNNDIPTPSPYVPPTRQYVDTNRPTYATQYSPTDAYALPPSRKQSEPSMRPSAYRGPFTPGLNLDQILETRPRANNPNTLLTLNRDQRVRLNDLIGG